MIEATLEDIVKATSAQSIEKLKMIKGSVKISTSYEIRKLVRAVNEKGQMFEESRLACIKELGVVPDGRGGEMLDPRKTPEFQVQMVELLKKVEKLDADPIKFSEIKDAEGLTADDLDRLDKFISY